MNKKICVVAIILTLCFALIFSMVACNGGSDENGDTNGSGDNSGTISSGGSTSGSGDTNGSGDTSGSGDSVGDGGQDSGINEVEEYIHILEVVVSSFFAGNDENYDDSESLATASAQSSAQSSLAYPEEIFAILSGAENKQDAGFAEDISKSLATDYFVELLAYSEAFHENYDTDKFYGVTVYSPSYEDEENGEFAQAGYITVESVGNHRIAYMYGSTEDGYSESFYVFDVEFVDDNNFSVTMLVIAEDDGVLENVYYSYADTDGRFLFVADDAALYAEDEGCLAVQDPQVIADGWSALESEFDAIDLEAMRAYEGNKDYVITYEQYKSASDALEEKFA